MIAMAISFPCSFLDDMVFIFYGNTGEEMVASFHDVQDLEMHVLNIRGYISWITRREDYDFTEDFYVAFLEGEITPLALLVICVISAAVFALSWALSVAFYKKRRSV